MASQDTAFVIQKVTIVYLKAMTKEDSNEWKGKPRENCANGCSTVRLIEGARILLS